VVVVAEAEEAGDQNQYEEVRGNKILEAVVTIGQNS